MRTDQPAGEPPLLAPHAAAALSWAPAEGHGLQCRARLAGGAAGEERSASSQGPAGVAMPAAAWVAGGLLLLQVPVVLVVVALPLLEARCRLTKKWPRGSTVSACAKGARWQG